MKILVISDIHGSASDLEKILDFFDKEKCTHIVIAGDFLNHGPRNAIPQGYDTKKAASLLNKYSKKIICVRGNCDSEVDQMMLEFPCLSDYNQIFLENGQQIFIHHGHKFTIEQLEKFLPQGTIVISGHTHIPLLKKQNGFLLLNPGSISIPKNPDGTFSNTKTWAIITTTISGISQIIIKNENNDNLEILKVNSIDAE